MLLHFKCLRGGTPVAGDTTPNAFSFTDQTNVALSSTITSTAITVSGIDSPTSISSTGGTFDINASGTFISSGTVNNGDQVRARHTSSGSNSTATNTIVTIGGVQDTFTSTTLASGANLLDSDFPDDNSSSPAYTVTSSSSNAAGQLSAHIWAGEDNSGHLEIQNFPSTSIRSMVHGYVANEDFDKAKFFPAVGTLKELCVEWDELRGSTFDFGTTKDWAFIYCRNTSTGSGAMDGQDQGQNYHGIGVDIGGTSGVNDCTKYGSYNQGPLTSGADIGTSAFVMARNTPYRFRSYCKVNTDGASDGTSIFDYSTDGGSNWTNLFTSTGIKLASDAGTEAYIKCFMFGFSATNGGAFADVSKIYRKNIQFYDGYTG